MEDAATAEISRAQLWQQWVSQGVTLADGRPCTRELYRHFREEETAQLAATAGSTRATPALSGAARPPGA